MLKHRLILVSATFRRCCLRTPSYKHKTFSLHITSSSNICSTKTLAPLHLLRGRTPFLRRNHSPSSSTQPPPVGQDFLSIC
ncbi:hypothetical protein Hanom_Chr05g00460361 [Helianthus anomalus]